MKYSHLLSKPHSHTRARPLTYVSIERDKKCLYVLPTDICSDWLGKNRVVGLRMSPLVGS